MKKLWRIHFDIATLVLVLATVGMNYLGKLFAELFKLPIWLDCIGTCLASMVAGPAVGAVVGVTNNIIYGLSVNPLSTIYALASMGIAIVVGIAAHKGYLKHRRGTIITGVTVGIVAAVISTLINVFIQGGADGGVLGTAVFTVSQETGMPLWLVVFLDDIILDIPDKILVLFATYEIGKVLPESFLELYQSKVEAGIDEQ